MQDGGQRSRPCGRSDVSPALHGGSGPVEESIRMGGGGPLTGILDDMRMRSQEELNEDGEVRSGTV